MLYEVEQPVDQVAPEQGDMSHCRITRGMFCASTPVSEQSSPVHSRLAIMPSCSASQGIRLPRPLRGLFEIQRKDEKFFAWLYLKRRLRYSFISKTEVSVRESYWRSSRFMIIFAMPFVRPHHSTQG